MPKTITKMDLAAVIQRENGLIRRRSQETVETLLKIIKDTLASGEDVRISGFGKFYLRHKAERKGRDPFTGKKMLLEKRRIVMFKYSRGLKQRMNGK